MNFERTQSTELVLDLEGTLSRFGGDRELFTDMVGFFFEDAPALCDELQAAVECEDAVQVRKKAHALKGLIASCGGTRAAHAAQRVEYAGETSDLESLEPLFTTLRDEFERLKIALEPHRG
jgi:HPt (histidine-containing phosphotransfer) domain-containing protein